MAIYPQPKGPTRKQVKAKAKRVARKVVKSVRAQCVERDGHCRYLYLAVAGDSCPKGHLAHPECDGPSEWAHLGDKKRARTRNMPAHIRHTTAGSLMLCAKHHDAYDAGEIVIVGSDANGALAFYDKGAVKV